MKLVYVLNRLPPDESGHFLHVLRLLQELTQVHQFRVHLIVERGPTRDVEIDGLTITTLRPASLLLRTGLLLIELVRLRRQGYRLFYVRISRPASIVTSLVARCSRGRSVYWLSTMGSFEYHDSLSGFKKVGHWLTDVLPTKLAARSAHRLVTGPPSMADYYVGHHLVGHDKIVVLPNDIDIERFPPRSFAQDRPCPVILSVCRLSGVRRVSELLPALPERLIDLGIDFRWIHVGGGPDLERIRRAVEASRASDRISLVGAVCNEEIGAYYRAADMFCLPSMAEGFPRVLLEAMASGLGLVAFDVGGVMEVVPLRQKEFIAPLGELEGMAQGLFVLLKDADLRDTLGRENRLHVVERFSTAIVASAHRREFEALVSSSASRWTKQETPAVVGEGTLLGRSLFGRTNKRQL